MSFRSGIIPYDPERDLFILAIDAQYQTIVDFGGTFDPTKDKDLVDTAIREAYEESIGILNFTREDLEHAIPIDNFRSTEYILPIQMTNPEAMREDFHQRRSTEKRAEFLENSDMIFVPREALLEYLSTPDHPNDPNGEVMYYQLKRLLRRHLRQISEMSTR